MKAGFHTHCGIMGGREKGARKWFLCGKGDIVIKEGGQTLRMGKNGGLVTLHTEGTGLRAPNHY